MSHRIQRISVATPYHHRYPGSKSGSGGASGGSAGKGAASTGAGAARGGGKDKAADQKLAATLEAMTEQTMRAVAADQYSNEDDLNFNGPYDEALSADSGDADVSVAEKIRRRDLDARAVLLHSKVP